MYTPLVAIFSILSLFVGSTNAVAFVLDPGSYPEVTDHHCIAFYCSGLNGFQRSPNGFHRDTNSGTSERGRRHAIGCDGVTDCHTSTTGQSCDEVWPQLCYGMFLLTTFPRFHMPARSMVVSAASRAVGRTQAVVLIAYTMLAPIGASTLDKTVVCKSLDDVPQTLDT